MGLRFRAQGYGFRIRGCVLPGVDSVGEWEAEGVAAPVEDFATCKAWIALGAEDFRVGGRQHPHLGFRVYEGGESELDNTRLPRA